MNRPRTPDQRRRSRERRRQIRRRRIMGVAVVATLLILAGVGLAGIVGGGGETTATAAKAPESSGSAGTTGSTADASTPATRSDRARLSLRTSFGGAISPKSVAASGTGLVFAQNMMYRHTVTVYDAKALTLRRTIPDTVNLARLGFPKYRGEVRGAPVEADFSPDGKYAYVSNYSMYGPGFGPEGSDECSPSSGYDRSFVYRIPLDTLKIDAAYQVGAVPKVVKTTPDGRYVLVANWCTWDLSVIATDAGRQVRHIPIGAYPRGIVVSPVRNVAYVAVMGGGEVVRVDLDTWKTREIPIGAGPRALVTGPNGRYLYATLNAEGTVARLDLRTGAVTKVTTGSAPRSMDIAPDGRSLYVVNYESGSVSKVRTSDMRVLQTVQACYHPIGITYEPVTGRVWVACYGGEILVFDDRETGRT